jgi:poly(ADP-ribose) glycohydrolase ARH3
MADGGAPVRKPRTLRDAFRGALLGSLAGDALGTPVAGVSGARIRRERGEVREMLEHPRHGKGAYGHDTQAAIVLAELLAEGDGFDPRRFAEGLAAAYDPARSWGRGSREVIRRLRSGEPWERAAEGANPRGSFANGAAARVHPVALLLHHDPLRLERLAEETAMVSHPHPLGVAGTLLQARQVALALDRRDETVDPIGVAVELRGVTRSAEFRQKLRMVEDCLEHGATPDFVHDRLGSSPSALGSVATALYAFLAHLGSFEDAVAFAVSLGGDAPSLGAMTGAIAGAWHGVGAIPRPWRTALEEGERGATHVEGLADRLLLRHLALRDARQRALRPAASPAIPRVEVRSAPPRARAPRPRPGGFRPPASGASRGGRGGSSRGGGR